MAEEGGGPSRPGASQHAAPTEPADVRPLSGRAPAGTPTDADPSDLAQALVDVMAAIRRMARRVTGSPGVLSSLTGSQIELVRTVHRRPGISVAEAAEELRLAPNTVSTLVGQLIDAGIVVRTPDREDRRVARLAIDPGAGRTVVGWYDRRTEAVASVLGRLSPHERRRLHDAQAVLATVATLLEEDAAAAERAADRRHGRGRAARRSEARPVAEPR